MYTQAIAILCQVNTNSTSYKMGQYAGFAIMAIIVAVIVWKSLSKK